MEIYFLFARLFREAPSAELLRTIAECKLLTEVRDFLREEEKIAVEFASLFLVPGEKMISPYESSYCDTLTIDSSTACSAYFEPETFPKEGLRGFLCGPSARSVEKYYKTFGFELSPSFHDLPDHISIELEFLGRLDELEKVEEIHKFFREHLGRWIESFLDKMLLQRTSEFYRAVAQGLRGYLEKYFEYDLNHKQIVSNKVI
ncbi:MAG: molecular chaperone TorD family protein [Candidatus Omnitrophica bacterium]|nr:molecular chaperone TorD family protein [Candidatus Omnitrophota bacterium]